MFFSKNVYYYDTETAAITLKLPWKMENTEAISGIRELFSKLDDEDLLGLAVTVTQGLLKNKIETRKEAIDSILKYSPDFKSILKRKVLTKELLFSYLHDNNIAVTLPASKYDLIDLISTYWNLKTNSITNVEFPTDKACGNPHESMVHAPIDVNALAIKFSEWFYTMLNSSEPIGREHFWNDVSFKLNLISATQSVTQEVQDNPLETTMLLFKTKIEHNLYFNPNFLTDGIQGRIDPHGLVAVMVCGTLHSNKLCVGVFEQVFMLARDPFSENNWKIKRSELNLKSKDNVSVPPRLCDSSLTSNLLSLPSS